MAMGSPSELSLDYKPDTAYRLATPKQPDSDCPAAEQTQKVEDFVARLQEERLKIEAFKRELPLCIQLVNEALETYRQQLGTCRKDQGARPVLEEFIPLSNMSINGSKKASTSPSEKANWMVSTQLWSDPPKHQQLSAPVKDDVVDCDAISPKLALDTKHRNGGAFLPFSKDKAGAVPELALASADKSGTEENKCSQKPDSPAPGAQSTQRKARRCWSPDLHRRFVNALQMLGGSQLATPKQIRELMKVDGLTNDEVKSHLQKYRLHTRRPMQQPQRTAAAAPHLVVLGGIWVPPEYAAAAAAGQSVFPPHHYSVPHDFYPPPPPHYLHHSAPAYKTAIRSPDSELRSGGGDRSESFQDEEEDNQEAHGSEEEEEEHQDETEQVKEENKALVPADKNGNGY